MNQLLNSMKSYTYTTNGDVARNTTGHAVLDMFTTAPNMRKSSEEECIELFRKAMDENANLALKCLFWVRDILGGAGERRYFRICYNWLAKTYPQLTIRLMPYVVMDGLGRYDDLFALFGTPCEQKMLNTIYGTLQEDKFSVTPSLLAKWMPSCNSASKETRALAKRFYTAWGWSERDYRKTLSSIRARLNLIETNLSQKYYDKINFSQLPSVAGLRYIGTFKNNPFLMRRYASFMKDKQAKVNSAANYPYVVVQKVFDKCEPWSNDFRGDETDRNALNKYWDNLNDYFKDSTLNALCVVDTSGSMQGTPLSVAISLGLYCATRANGPFKNHYISFSQRPQLVEFNGKDFVDNVVITAKTNLCQNTNIEATMRLVLHTAINNHLVQADLPETLVIISDMQFDRMSNCPDENHLLSVMERMRREFARFGFRMPKIVYWNVKQGKATFPEALSDEVSFVGGCSPSLFKGILTGKTALDLMYEVLRNERYVNIHM